MATSPPQPYRGSYLLPRLDEATVADSMHAGVLSCSPDATLRDVARIMSTNRVHCVIVSGTVGEHGDRLVWGIVSDMDLMAAAHDPESVTAGEVAATEAVSVDASTPLAQAAQLMAEHETSHLVVTSARREMPVGIISSLDIAHALAWGRQPG